MITIATDTIGLVGVDLELVPRLVTGATVFQYADNLSYVNWFFTHYASRCIGRTNIEAL